MTAALVVKNDPAAKPSELNIDAIDVAPAEIMFAAPLFVKNDPANNPPEDMNPDAPVPELDRTASDPLAVWTDCVE